MNLIEPHINHSTKYSGVLQRLQQRYLAVDHYLQYYYCQMNMLFSVGHEWALGILRHVQAYFFQYSCQVQELVTVHCALKRT